MSGRAASAHKPPVEPSLQRGLWRAFARGVRDNVIAETVVQALRLGGMVVLARALLPADFGILKVLLVVSVVARLVNEAGIPDALVQRKELRPEHEATAWWLSVALATLAALALWVGAPAVARLMAMPELTGGARLLCIPIFLEGTVITATARLRRQLRFGVLAAADVLAEVSFLLTGLLLLWRGQPQWSLPGGLAARFVVHAATIWLAEPRVPWGMPRIAAARELSRFALSVWGGHLLVVASTNADYVLVGRLLGSTALGFYAMAWDLLRFIPDRLHKVAGRVTLPAFCKLQDDDRALARAYLNFFGYTARVVLPIVACVAVAAPELIGTIYGRQWLPAAVPLRILVPGLALLGLRLGIGSIYYAKDHPSFDIHLNGARLVLIVLAVTALAPSGLVGVSAGMSAVEAVISVAGQGLACGLIGLRLRDLAAASWGGLRLAVACTAACAAGEALALALGLHGLPVMVAVTAGPAITFCGLQAADLSQMLGQAFARRVAETAEMR